MRRLSSLFSKTTALKSPHSRLGQDGEKIAARFLKKRGLKILYRNFQPRRGGEVDLVCRVRGRLELVFVEVKTRSDEAFGAPHHAVDAEKRHRMILAAEEWLDLLNRPEVIARFDIVEVVAKASLWEVRHIENAFLAHETLHPGSFSPTLAAIPTRAPQVNARVNEGQFPRHLDRY